MRNIIIKTVSVIFAVVMLSSCGDDTATVSNPEAVLSATSAVVKLGDEYQLNVENYDGEVKWSSSDNKVAAVNSEGMIQSLSVGRAAVTAEMENGESKTCVVDVQPGVSVIQSIAVTSMFSSSSDITVDYTKDSVVRLKAVCTPGAEEKLLWSTSDSKIATVDNSGNVTVCGNGMAEIKATALNGVEGKCIVRVKNAPANAVSVPVIGEGEIPSIESPDDTISKFTSPIPVNSPSAKTSVIISDKNVYLEVGDDFTLEYAVGNTQMSDVRWESSDRAVAIVKAGRIVAIGNGRCVISAVTVDGAVAKCQVAVGREEIKKMKKEVADSKK